MKYYTIPPGASLQGIVNFFWVAECDGAPEESFTYFSTADSCPKLIFPYRLPESVITPADRTFFASGIQGQTQSHGRFATPKQFGMFGMYLFPYAIPSLFALPASALSNQLLGLETLLGEAGKVLAEQMEMATDNGQRMRIISGFFDQQLKRHYHQETAITLAIQQIRRQQGLVNIRDLASEYCLSQKQFERKFRELSGFMPKLYARIVRFEAVLQNYPTYESLTQLGYACGYYDQAHFIHDFKAFSGHHPKSYFAAVPQLA